MENHHVGGANQRGGLPLPKLNIWELSLYIADLVLVSDGSIEWVKEPRIRRLWQVNLFSLLVLALLQSGGGAALEGVLDQSASATLVWRCFFALGSVWLLCTTALLTCRYYRYLLITGKDVRFRHIAIFWSSWVVLFGYLYRALYFLKPSLYSFADPALVPQKTLSFIGVLPGVKLTMQFLLYSASITVTLSVPGLSSSSFLVSSLNLFEVLGSVLLAGLLIATFVNRSGTSRE